MTDVVQSGFKYKAFISYSHKDDAWAAWLLKSLERYRLPNHIRAKHPLGPLPKRLGHFFRDREDLPATGHMTDRIFEALADSEFLIVICSPDATRSKLVNREIAEFKRVRNEGNILCVIVGGTPFADNPSEECFPDALRLQFTGDGVFAKVSAENLAADAREEGDGKRYAVLKLVAGMLRIGLNDLVRRENQFRHRRIATLAVAASVGMACMGALALDAHTARKRAEVAQQLAETKSREAQRSAAQLEELTVFVMSSVYDELITAGSVSVLESMSEKIVRQLDRVGLENMSLSQTGQLIAAYLRLGQALERQGESTRAREYFDTAQNWAWDLFKRFPNDSTAISRLQTSLFFTGYLSRRQGDYAAAEKDFLERLRLTRIALETNPTSQDQNAPAPVGHWEEEVADSEAHLCDLQYVPLGKPFEALERCRTSVALRRLVVEMKPDEEEHWVNLASSYYFLANCYLALGRNIEAKEALLSRHTIYISLLRKEPRNYRILRRSAMNQQVLASIEQRQGNTDKALQLLASARETFDGLTAQDPSNIMWLADSADVYRDSAEILLGAGDLFGAGDMLAVADEQIMQALSTDMSRTSRRLSAHKTRLLKAELAIAKSENALATTYMREAAAHFEGEDPGYLLVPGALEFASKLYVLKGDLLARSGSNDAATEAWQHVVDMFEASSITRTPALRLVVADAYRKLGHLERAEAVISNKGVGR
ncbi:toll/interleukin-1 receptor domain-containing protein [Kordiimonas gwangyangensis]|uniref:toll/interleukin-1 receptor domain-containing protein n=1 Tax=Kordiimonas gwangyangensis TaxID=288022 RepID=UPI0003822ECA|nr:toll/interleukin-1 receptor domain-containing protein [Kordiimonas gwangyangensis]